MTTEKRIIHTPHDTARLIVDLKARDLPFKVALRDGVDRTVEQNSLVHKWFGEIANWQGDLTNAEVKAQCNLTYGRPILARDNDEWGSAFGYIFDSLSYSAKLKAIRVLDIPFTRIMGVKQLSEYMVQMHRDYREQGVPLTDPELRKYEVAG